MPNWCENKLTVKGKSEELVKLIEEHVVDDELDYKTFNMNKRLFGENHFDTDKILNEGIGEITFWFSTKWSQVGAEDVCDEINNIYPDLESRLSFFSVESGFWGYYNNEDELYLELNDDNEKELAKEFIQFGEEEGFLIKTENEEYSFAHDVPTFRLI
jgi:hypothetical protein